MQPFEQHHGDEGCPYLDAKGVLGGADEGLDLEVLLERLQEQLDLPALLLDRGDNSGAEVEMVCEEHDLAPLVGVPDNDAAQEVWTFGGRRDAGEADNPIGENVAVLWWFAFLDHLVDGVLLHAGDEEDAVLGPSGEQAVIVAGPVHGDNGARCEADFPGRRQVVAPGLLDQYEGWHVIAIIDARGASTSQIGRFETEPLATDDNLAALTELPSLWIDRVHDRPLPSGLYSTWTAPSARNMGKTPRA